MEHTPPRMRHRAQPDNRLQRFAKEYGWWRVVAIPVMSVITVWMLVDVATGSDEALELSADQSPAPIAAHSESAHSHEGEEGETGPDPALAEVVKLAIDQLPPGGKYAEKGDGTYRVVGEPGMEAGEGTEKVVRYTTEIENGIDTSAYGGDAAFAAMVDATLSDPRGWTNDPQIKFVHVSPHENPDSRIRLTSLETTAELCGDQLRMETSCHTTITGESTVVLNESRWVRGARTFEGDVGNYRQYLINHEVGHAIGYASHQQCGGNGQLAPIMMQQTIDLNNKNLALASPDDIYSVDSDLTCEPNPWPYPNPKVKDPHNPSNA